MRLTSDLAFDAELGAGLPARRSVRLFRARLAL
jgi:hypothetical protein